MKDIISMRDFSRKEILYVLDFARDIKNAIHDGLDFKKKYGRDITSLLQDITVGTLFLENSTRTYFSLRAAVQKAGGSVDGFTSEQDTSLKKGETWASTVSMFANYGFNALAMRSTLEGLPRWSADVLQLNYAHMQSAHHLIKIPYAYHKPLILNGGDGKNQHPTQCFLDLFTIQELAQSHGKELDGLDIALLNDLAHGRTNASLMSVAPLFDFKLHLAYPPRFGPRKQHLDDLARHNISVTDYGSDFLEAMKQSFIAYQSRPQKERVGKGEDLITIKAKGQINKKLYDRLGEHAPYLLHPLPVDAETFEEISSDLSYHPKNMTSIQSSNGLYIRIALLTLGLDIIENPLQEQSFIEKPYFLETLPLSSRTKFLDNPRSGVIDDCGIVLDHIPAGMGRRLEGILGLEKEGIPFVSASNLQTTSGTKDLIKIHRPYSFTQGHYEAMALLGPDITVNLIEHGIVRNKLRPHLGTLLQGRVQCNNESCVSHVSKEHVTSTHHVEHMGGQTTLRCHYCESVDSVSHIYEQNRFIYL